jgi:tRNA threonylcarbamoyl adenosine modification protein YjeE
MDEAAPGARIAASLDRFGKARNVALPPDPDATRQAGARLAGAVRGGDAIALVGDLGAGKTTLVTGLVAALGGGAAASPTFSLINEYRHGRLRVWHVDLYRLDREAELVELGLDDLIGDRRGVVLVEWADKFAVMPPDHLRIELAHDGDTRVLTATGTGPRGTALARVLG